MSVLTAGFLTLFNKEVRRFYKVSAQTVLAPVVSAALYLLVFGKAAAAPHLPHATSYASFLLPGLIMMSLLQNGFSNASSSIVQSKVSGSLVFVRLAPLSHREILFAYVGAAAVRALIVGAGVYVSTVWLVPLSYAAPLWIFSYAAIGALISGLLGFVVGVWAEKFDQLAASQNFLMMPATLLAGVFYDPDSLSSNWSYALHWNPFFYLVDGFRFGFTGHSDVTPWTSLLLCGLFLAALYCLAMAALRHAQRVH